MEIPYGSSPDTQDILATLEANDGTELDVLDDGARFIVDGIPEDALLLTLTVSAEDDLGNVSTTTRSITISVFELRAKLRVLPVMTARVTITKVFRMAGKVGKILQGWLKIDQGDR